LGRLHYMMGHDLIYESPDKGETIYARKVGSTDRVLISMSEKAWSRINEQEQAEVWKDIRGLAKTNPSLNDVLDRLLVVYNLIKKENSL
jgi:hypothetical protein